MVDALRSTEVPTELSPPGLDFRNRDVELHKDRLHAKYVGEGRSASDVGCLLGNRPVPRNVVAFYFEATCINAGEEGRLTIGFVPEGWKAGRQPGWDENSYGYHGRDGKKYSHSTQGEEFGPTFTAGDVVGAGIIHGKQEIFFTSAPLPDSTRAHAVCGVSGEVDDQWFTCRKNGTMLAQPAFKNVNLRTNLFPAISMRSRDEAMAVNFGATHFVFDIQVVVAEERAARRSDIAKLSVPAAVTHHVVREFLIHHAHVDTLAVFDRSWACLPPSLCGGGGGAAAAADATRQGPLRKAVVGAVLAGRPDAALRLLAASWPGLMQQPYAKAALLHLRCHCFLERVRAGDVLGALDYGRRHLAPFQRDPALTPAQRELLGDTVATIAYADLAACPVVYLTEPSQRAAAAAVANATILRHLERLGAGAGGGAPPPGDADVAMLTDERSPAEAAAVKAPATASDSGGAPMELDQIAAADITTHVVGNPGSDKAAAVAGTSATPPSDRLPTSLLEGILQQLAVVMAQLHELAGSGEAFDLQRELRRR